MLDDDQVDQMLLSKGLTSLGYPEPLLASSAEEAYEICANQKVDIALLDIVLPGLTDGIEVGQTLSQTYNIPIIFITSHSSKDLLYRASHINPYGYLIKPLDATSLNCSLELAMNRHHLERRLAGALDEAQSLAEQNADAIVVVHDDGRLYFANQAAGNLFSEEPKDLVGHQFGVPRAIDQDPVEVEVINSSGEPIPCEMRVSEITWRGEPALLASIRDISQRKKYEEERAELAAQLQQAQKMEALGTLASGIAHDFNNILAAVMGYAELAQNALDNKHPVQSDIGGITRAAARAKELIRHILTFSRKAEASFKPLSLNRTVENTADLLKRTLPKMVGIKLELSEGLKPVNANPQQLEQVILNLATNAADAMQGVGEIIISTGRVEVESQNCDACGLVYNGEFDVVSIKDSGTGMSPEVVCKVFDPFFTTKETGKGTGLGLSIVFGIVNNHGGFLTCDSQPGMGTEIKVHLPVLDQDIAEVSHIGASAQANPTGGKTILIVDDEPYIREIAGRFLESGGYGYLEAESGERALQLYAQNRDSIDGVILDLGMPGMGGKTCLAELRKINPEVKVLIASGYMRTESDHTLVDLGAWGVLEKPYFMASLIESVSEMLDS